MVVSSEPVSARAGRLNSGAPASAKATGAELVLRRCIGVGSSNGTLSPAVAWHPAQPDQVAYTAACNVVLMHASTKEQIRVFRTKRHSTLSTLAFRPPSGQHIAAAEGDTSAAPAPEIFIWDTDTGKLVKTLKHHKHGIASLAYSQDGRWLLSAGAGYDGQLCVWDWSAGTVIARATAQMAILSACFAQDSSSVLCAGKEQIKMWAIVAGSSTTAILKGTRPGSAGSNAPSAQITLQSKVVGFKDFKEETFIQIQPSLPAQPAAQPGVPVMPLAPTPPHTYAVTKSGLLLLLSRMGSRVAVDKSVNLQAKSVRALAVSASLVAVGCGDALVRLFAANTLVFKSNLPRPSPTSAAARRCSMVGYSAGARGAAPGSFGAAAAGAPGAAAFPDVLQVSFTVSGTRLAASYADHSLVVWNVEDTAKAPQSTSVVTCSADGSVRVWALQSSNGSSSEPINRARTCGTVRGVLIARATDLSDSPWSANQTTANDHTLSTEDSKPVPLRCLCVSQCGTHLATGDMLGNIRVHDLNSLSLIRDASKEAHEGPVLCMEYSPAHMGLGAGFLATGGRDGAIHIFDVSSGYVLVNSLDDHAAAVTAVRFSPCGKYLVSASANRQLTFRQITNPQDCTIRIIETDKQPGGPAASAPSALARAGPAAAAARIVAGAGVRGLVHDIAVHGSVAVAAVSGCGMCVYALERGQLICQVEVPGLTKGPSDVVRVRLDTTGTRTLCAWADGSIALLDISAALKQQETAPQQPQPARRAQEPTGRAAAPAARRAAAAATPRVPAQVLARAAAHADVATAALLLPDGAVSVGADGCLLQWQLPAGLQPLLPPATNAPVALPQPIEPNATHKQFNFEFQRQTKTQPELTKRPSACVAVVALDKQEDTSVLSAPGSKRSTIDESGVARGAREGGGGWGLNDGNGFGRVAVDEPRVTVEDPLDDLPMVASPTAHTKAAPPAWCDPAARAELSRTIQRARQGLPLQSPDKLPRWAAARLEAAALADHDNRNDNKLPTTTLNTMQGPVHGTMHGGNNTMQAACDAKDAPAPTMPMHAHAAAGLHVGGSNGVVSGLPQGGLWSIGAGIDLESDDDLCAYEDSEGELGCVGEPSSWAVAQQKGDGGGEGGSASGLQGERSGTVRDPGDGSLDGEDLSVIDEDLTSVTGMSEITGLPGVTTPSVLALSALSIGDGESHDNNTGDTTGVGAGGRSGYASNDPTARAAGAAGGRRSGESEGDCERPLARDLCRDLYGDCSTGGDATAAVTNRVGAAAAPLPPGFALDPAQAALLASASDQSNRRWSLTSAVRKLATSMLAAGPVAGQAMLDTYLQSQTQPAAPHNPTPITHDTASVPHVAAQDASPATAAWAGTPLPASERDQSALLGSEGAADGSVERILREARTPGLVAAPAVAVGAEEAVSAYTPVPVPAPRAGLVAAREAQRNQRAGRMEGDLAKMRERLAALQSQFASQQAKNTPWKERPEEQQPPSPAAAAAADQPGQQLALAAPAAAAAAAAPPTAAAQPAATLPAMDSSAAAAAAAAAESALAASAAAAAQAVLVPSNSGLSLRLWQPGTASLGSSQAGWDNTVRESATPLAVTLAAADKGHTSANNRHTQDAVTPPLLLEGSAGTGALQQGAAAPVASSAAVLAAAGAQAAASAPAQTPEWPPAPQGAAARAAAVPAARVVTTGLRLPACTVVQRPVARPITSSFVAANSASTTNTATVAAAVPQQSGSVNSMVSMTQLANQGLTKAAGGAAEQAAGTAATGATAATPCNGMGAGGNSHLALTSPRDATRYPSAGGAQRPHASDALVTNPLDDAAASPAAAEMALRRNLAFCMDAAAAVAATPEPAAAHKGTASSSSSSSAAGAAAAAAAAGSAAAQGVSTRSGQQKAGGGARPSLMETRAAFAAYHASKDSGAAARGVLSYGGRAGHLQGPITGKELSGSLGGQHTKLPVMHHTACSLLAEALEAVDACVQLETTEQQPSKGASDQQQAQERRTAFYETLLASKHTLDSLLARMRP